MNNIKNKELDRLVEFAKEKIINFESNKILYKEVLEENEKNLLTEDTNIIIRNFLKESDDFIKLHKIAIAVLETYKKYDINCETTELTELEKLLMEFDNE